MKNSRIVYFDYLRIVAALAVIMVHVAATRYGTYYGDLIYYCIVRWGVPIFVMISGTLFLEPTKNITINNILTKYIFRIAIVFIIWSLIYASGTFILEKNFRLQLFITKFIIGHHHMWFLYMIAALYLITPLLRPITEKKDKHLILYLLIIWFIMTSIFPYMVFLLPKFKQHFDLMVITKLHFSFPLYFTGYFFLGYYLHNYVNIKNKILPIIIILSCMIITILGDIKHSAHFLSSFYTDHICPFIVITSICIFLLVKNKYSHIKQSNKFILQLSNLSLGVYLIHPIFIKISKILKLYTSINFLLNDKDFITIPIVFIVVSLCSFISVYLLSKIPIIKKYCL